MKYSLYNSTIYVGGCHTLLYNSFSGKFIVVKNSLLDITKESPQLLSTRYNSLYQQMVEANMIVCDSSDEIEMLQERISAADNNFYEYILHINPTLDCNFDCWYCYENHIPHSKMNTEVLCATKLFISSVLQRPEIKSFELGFFGGEPLLYFNHIAKNIIDHAGKLCGKTEKKLHVHFTSNGSLLTDDIIRFLSKYSCGFQITLDGGEDQHNMTRFYKNKRGSFKDIVKNIHRLVAADIDVIVRVNYTSSNIDSVASVQEYFMDIPEEKKKFIRFDFQRVWQDRGENTDLTEEKISAIRRAFKEYGFVVLANYLPCDVRNSCYGDKLNHILINYNGDVFGCTARDFSQENRIGFIDANGVIHYDTDTVAKRNNSKLSKKICKSCRIAPLCGGGCKQRASESPDGDKCTFNYTDEEIDNMILDIFEYSYNTH